MSNVKNAFIKNWHKTAISSTSLRVPCHKTMVGSLFIATELDSYLTSFCWCLSLISRSVTLLVCRFNFRENSSLSLSRVSFISLSKKQIKYIRLGYLPSHSHPHRPAAVRSKGSGDEIATVCAHAFGFIARKRNGKGWKLLRLSIKSNPLKWSEMEPKVKCMLIKFCTNDSKNWDICFIKKWRWSLPQNSIYTLSS